MSLRQERQAGGRAKRGRRPRRSSKYHNSLLPVVCLQQKNDFYYKYIYTIILLLQEVHGTAAAVVAVSFVSLTWRVKSEIKCSRDLFLLLL